MILSNRQIEIQNIIDDLRKQVLLLDSHKTVGLINDKQYKESIYHIAKKVDALEVELGIEPYKYNAYDVMYNESMEKFEQEIAETLKDTNEE